MALALFIHLGDYIVTAKAVTEFNAVEVNPLNRWLFKKLGMPVTTFIEAGFVLFLGCLIASKDISYGVTFVSIFSAVQGINLIRGVVQYLKLKK